MSEYNDALKRASVRGYTVSKLGEVYGPSGKALRLRSNPVFLTFGVRRPAPNRTMTRVRVHRFVAYKKFGDVIFGKGIQVRHLDGNKHNNSWDNIDVGSQSENMMDRDPSDRIRCAKAAAKTRRKLTEEQVHSMRVDRANGAKYSELISRYGVCKATVSSIINGKTYSGIV